MDAIAAYLGKDRTEVGPTNFIQPDEFPYEHGLVFQDGRPLTYDSGDYPASLVKLKALVGWDEFQALRGRWPRRGTPGRDRPRLLRRGHRRRPLRGRPRARRDLRQGQGRDRPDQPGPGPPDRVRAARRRRARGALRGRRGGHRRHPPDAVRRGHVRLPRGGDERLGDPPGGAAHPARRRCGSRPRRWRPTSTTSRSSTASCRCRGARRRARLGTVAVLSNPLRYAFDEASKSATQFAVGDPGKPPVAEGEQPGLEGTDFYSPERSTFASGMHAVIVETDPDTAEITILQVRRRPRLRPPDQPDDRRGPDPRRRRAGRRRRALREDGVRRARPAAQRLLHGLPDALRHRGPDRASRSTTSRPRHRSTRSASRAPARPA